MPPLTIIQYVDGDFIIQYNMDRVDKEREFYEDISEVKEDDEMMKIER